MSMNPDRIVVDGHTLKCLVLDKDGNPVRPGMTVLIDTFTGFILDIRMPKHFYTDNGSSHTTKGVQA